MKIIRMTVYLILFISIMYYFNTDETEKPIDCTSSLAIVNGKRTLLLAITFSTYNGNGLFTLTGNTDGVEDNIIIRKIFTYQKYKNNIYVFKNKDSQIRLPSLPMGEEIEAFFPHFLMDTKKEDEFIVKIIKIKKGMWAFMSTNTPYFVCENIRS